MELAMLFRNPRLDTTMGRATTALLCGAATGAALNAAYVLLSDGLTGKRPDEVFGWFFVLFFFSGVVWLAGVFTLGAGGWCVLHERLIRGPAAAALYGAVLTGGFVRVFTADLALCGLYALAGGLSSLVVWAIAYRPVRASEPEVES
jgi:drug/metabolite transporter (DMT)-like permease